MESIRRRGEMVSAFELETALRRHPKIDDVAIHGVSLPSEVDQAIKACVVVSAGESIEPSELAGWFATELPYFASPRFVEIMTELPTNASGRAMKFALRERSLSAAVWDLEALGLSIRRADRRRAGTTLQ